MQHFALRSVAPKHLLPFLLFGLFFLPAVVQGFAHPQQPIDFLNYPLHYLLSVTHNLLLLAFSLVGFFKTEGRPFADSGLQRPARKQWVLVPLYWLLLCLASAVLLGLSARFLPQAVNSNRIPLSKAGLWPLLILSLIVVAYSEEFFFRNYWLLSLGDFLPMPLAVVLCNLFFSLGHAYQGMAAVPAAFVLGLVLTAFRLKSHSVHITAAVHFLYDLTAVLLSFS